MEPEGLVKIYETIIIFDPLDYEESVTKISDLLQCFTDPKYKIKVDRLGVKKLAYPIKKIFTEGYYVVFTWMGTSDNVTELERTCRTTDNILKFITVRKEDDYELEEVEFIPDEFITSSELNMINQDVKSEQVDALDVLLGLADYKRKE